MSHVQEGPAFPMPQYGDSHMYDLNAVIIHKGAGAQSGGSTIDLPHTQIDPFAYLPRLLRFARLPTV